MALSSTSEAVIIPVTTFASSLVSTTDIVSSIGASLTASTSKVKMAVSVCPEALVICTSMVSIPL